MRTLYLVLLLLVAAANTVNAQEVVKVQGELALLSNPFASFEVGQVWISVSSQGKPEGILKIAKVKGSAAVGKITKGKTQAGSKLWDKTQYLNWRQMKLTAAKAPPAPPPPPPAAKPQEEAVKSNHQFNFKTNPLGMLFGFINIEGEYLMQKMGFSLGYTSISTTQDDVETSGSNIAVRGNYYFNQPLLSDGGYVGASLGLISEELTATVANVDYIADASGVSAAVYGGYMWAWKYFNLGLGIGYAYYGIEEEQVGVSSRNTRATFTAPISGSSLVGEMWLGVAF